jgi:3-oxoacyl-[acyl-carrier-protein] synthase II
MTSSTRPAEDCDRRRVVVTGIGVIAPNGLTPETFWKSVAAGESAARPLTRFPPQDAPVRIACEIHDFDPTQYMDVKAARRLDRSLLFGVAAASEAVEDARIDCTALDADRVAVVEGTSVSTNERVAMASEAYAAKGYKGVSLFGMINGYAGGGSGEISLRIGARGHSMTMSTGSASGNDVIGYGSEMIRRDDADVVVAGGAEAPIMPTIWAAFCQGKVMTRHGGDPREAMRPFDADRDGFILGEGAAFLVLEELTHALQRGARIYCEVMAQGSACESYHPVAPHPEGAGILRAMDKAVRRARLQPADIGYVNAHGTATESNDVVETRAIRRFFGPHARRLAVSSTKPVTGHLMAAAGALESAVCALAVYHQTMPPTCNLRHPAAECDLDFVREGARRYPIRYAMNLNSGFGGKNACLLLGRFEGGA